MNYYYTKKQIADIFSVNILLVFIIHFYKFGVSNGIIIILLKLLAKTLLLKIKDFHTV